MYDFVRNNRTFEKFTEMYNSYWCKAYGFVTINLTLKAADGKYMDKFESVTLT